MNSESGGAGPVLSLFKPGLANLCAYWGQTGDVKPVKGNAGLKRMHKSYLRVVQFQQIYLRNLNFYVKCSNF